MTIPPCWVRTIPARWPERALAWLLAALVAASGLCAAQSLETLARACRKSPSAKNRAALARFAAARPSGREGALALLAAGVAAAEEGQYAEAARNLKVAGARLPELADYAAAALASAQLERREYTAAAALAERVLEHSPASPLGDRAALLAARAHIEAGQAAEAASLLRRRAGVLEQPQGELLLASALEAAADLPSAALRYQHVYYDHPAAPEAAQAAASLERLRAAMGGDYPPPAPQARLARAMKLAEAGQFRRARQELEAMIPELGPTERDLARVRLGVVDYLARENGSAYRRLKSLEVSSPEADAERLNYIVACARRLNSGADMRAYLEELARRHPDSPWRLEALLAAGNHYLLDNQPDVFVPLYRACYESFPGESRAAYCHWKVAWREYLARSPQAAATMREHLRRYPNSEKTSAALYFLGRLAEEARDVAAAKAWYVVLESNYPNYYYGVLARWRLAGEAVARAAPSAAVREFLSTALRPPRDSRPSFDPGPVAKARIERARLLAAAAFDDWAEQELRFGAKTEGEGWALAIEAARNASRRGAPEKAIRYIKAMAPGYLYLPLEAAPAVFWRLAFPFPYRAEIEKYGRLRSLDPFMLAALIRQESEFDPRAVSRSKAYGLTQVLPSTGRQLSRRVGIRRFSTALLFRPEVNLNLGTYYVRSHLDGYQGRWEVALASYNAGKSRADAWLTWAEYREPAEFIETIPFTETRNYVQIVLRNADFYRRLYGPGGTHATEQKR